MKIDNSLPLEYSTEENRLKIFGFWVFLGAEIMIFATLFTVYSILESRIGNGPSGADIFSLPGILAETFILLASSFTIGITVHAFRIGMKKAGINMLIITLILGLSFVGIEVYEFFHYAHEGATFSASAFASSLLLTLGTHGAHVTFGLFWGIAILVQLLKNGLNAQTANKTFIFSLYWHFLDVVWIFIFSFVYLKGLM